MFTSYSASDLTQAYTNPAGTLYTHPAGYAVVRYHPGRWQATDMGELLTHLGQLLLDRNWNHALTDARQLPALSADSQTWLENNWLGVNALRPQPMHMAVVHPVEVFARLSAAQMRFISKGTTHYTYFFDEAQAHTHVLVQLATHNAQP